VDSLASVGPCETGGGQCAFAETNRQRVVELRANHDGGAGAASVGGEGGGESDEWYPARVIQAPPQADAEPGPRPGAAMAQTALAAGSLRLMGGGGGWRHQRLGALRTLSALGSSARAAHGPQQVLEAIDGRSGETVGAWALPATIQWSSMCSVGEDLFLLAAGAEPAVWRFPLPAALRGTDSELGAGAAVSTAAPALAPGVLAPAVVQSHAAAPRSEHRRPGRPAARQHTSLAATEQ